MRSRTGLLVAVLLPAMLLAGCVMGRVYRDHPLDEVKIATIQRGQTTKQEILDLFGPPQEIDARELTAIGVPFEPFISRRGEKPPVERIVAARYFRYTYTRANAMAIILILFNYGEFDQKSDNLIVFFDGDNKVEDFAFSRDTDQLPRYGFWSR
jgi:outer membrane protein assembly factor BamE (lipoprotein component of BamABCDE complex)